MARPLKELCIVMPRCLCSVTFGICIPPIITWESDKLGEEELCLMERCSLFSALNSIYAFPKFLPSLPQSAYPTKETNRLSWKVCLYAVVSSAKRAHSFNSDCGKSLMYVAPCSRPVPYSRHSPYSRHFVQHLLVLFQGFHDSL